MPLSQLVQVVVTQAQPAQGGLLDILLPAGLVMLVFYFLLIRPQQKAAKDHQNLIGSLKREDEVVTNSGIYGTIKGITETVVTLEIAPDVRIKMQRNQIAGLKNSEPAQKK